MSQPLLAYNVWLSLPAETRMKLMKLFGIPRTGEVVVQTGEMINGNIGSIVKNDGHAAGDLYAITTEKMQALLKTDDTDFYKMFNHIVENIDYLTEPKVEETVEITEIVTKQEKGKFAALMTTEVVEVNGVQLDKPKKKGGSPKKHG